METKAVGFDLDGTLYPERRLYLASAGLALRRPRLFWAYGEARKSLRRKSSGLDGYPPEGLRERQARLVAERLHIDVESAALEIEERVYGGMEGRFAGLRPFTGVRTCLERLRGAGLRLGVLSDLPPRVKLEALGLADLFDAALCSEDSGALKPSHLPFRSLTTALEVEPGELVYVGNKYGYDCVGAKAMGMKTALLGRKAGPDADLAFSSWETLTAWILGPGASLPRDRA